ncbi:membrane metallo-endopeptidase-like 1 [Coccinella septempunctata]|uniref:membrane metallo-endopeptidase-like 1 n=1 Tax=Coccinella septempunctata TaxID=41139 RepID=UPI001D097FAB|nr:membrane metallo-endopeptidase-like 1 [Coccinella septempunctata]
MLEPSKNRANDEKQRRNTGLEKGLISAVTLVSVVAVVFLILFVTKKCSSEEECTDKNCVKAAAELLEFVDLKKDPCNDFYHYVCGHYIKEAVKNDAPTPILQISKQVENEKKAIIVDPILKKDSKSNVAMKKFYQACMNETRIDADKDANFWEAINELGGWPLVNGSDWEGSSFDWVDWHIKSVKLGVPVIGFFDFKPATVSENTTILRITKSAIARVSLSRYEYRSLLGDIMKAFNATGGSHEDISEAYEFWKNVKKLADDFKEDDDDEADISTVEDLYRECQHVPWIKLLNGLSDGVREFQNDTEIVFGSIGNYCEKLQKLLRDTSTRIIANYYVWTIIHNSHHFMSKKVREAYENLEDESEERYKKCFDLTDESFLYLKETIYIRRKTNPQVRQQLDELVEIMKTIFIEHIKTCTWMDEDTKKLGIKKTLLLKKVIGADDILYDVDKFDKILGVNELEFSSDVPYQVYREKRIRENKHVWETVYEETQDEWKVFFNLMDGVNAFFSPSRNTMVIPAPILTSIYFNYKLPAFMNYGSIGRVVAHEMQHGFGEDGRRVILEDDHQIDWWSNATAEAFNETKQCVIEEYERIPFTYKLNGTLTLEENLADIVGIDVAYEAYNEWVKKYGEEKKLPGIPLTPKQIFWIQTGTSLCFRKLDDDSIDLNLPDDHPIPSFRVTAGARNSRYFAKDFDCPVGSFMNPKEKCRIL